MREISRRRHGRGKADHPQISQITQINSNFFNLRNLRNLWIYSASAFSAAGKSQHSSTAIRSAARRVEQDDADLRWRCGKYSVVVRGGEKRTIHRIRRLKRLIRIFIMRNY